MKQLGTASGERPAPVVATVGRPRDPDISDAILTATLELIGEEGYAHLTIAEVALRAGVHKPAVYRRWANKLDLAVAAIQLLAPEMPQPDTGDVRADLVEMLVAGAGNARDRDRVATLLRLQAEVVAEPVLAAAVDERITGPLRAGILVVLERGVRTRQLRAGADLELAVDMLFAPLTRKALRGTGVRMSRREAARVVDQLIDGLGHGTKKARR